MWGRANINHWRFFFFPSRRCHRLTVWVMNLRLRDQINPGCRSPCRTPTGWCRSEAGHANPGWSRSILVCPGWLAIMHVYFYVWHIITVVARSFFCWHTSDLWMYISHFPRFWEFWCPVHICQFTERFFFAFPSVVCGFLESNLQTLTNLDWHENCFSRFGCLVLCHHFQNLLISFFESGPSDGAGEGERYTEGRLTQLPHVFLLFLKWPKLVCCFFLLCKQVME